MPHCSTAATHTPLPTLSHAHVWPLDLDRLRPAHAALAALLDASETARAARFIFGEHRERYAIGRGMVRRILSNYLGCDPREITFNAGFAGKPSLAAPFNGQLEFNLAHCDGKALLAVARSVVGVDIERVRVLEDFDELVTRFFSKAEAAQFQKLAPGQKPDAFFNLWTRKEAMLKATGEGIAHELSRVEVTFLDGIPPAIQSVPASFGTREFWTLRDLRPFPGMAAAIAVRNREAGFEVVNMPRATLEEIERWTRL